MEQLAARGTELRNWLGWSVFGREIFLSKTMTFHDVTTILNERKHLKMLTRSDPDANFRPNRVTWPRRFTPCTTSRLVVPKNIPQMLVPLAVMECRNLCLWVFLLEFSCMETDSDWAKFCQQRKLSLNIGSADTLQLFLYCKIRTQSSGYPRCSIKTSALHS